MSQEWMKKSRLSEEYANGVEEFIQFELDHGADPKRIRCPCVKCSFIKWITVEQIREHRITKGISQGYKQWRLDGEEVMEEVVDHSTCQDTEELAMSDTLPANQFDELFHNIEANFQDNAGTFESLLSDAHQPLYTGCTMFMRMSTLLKLYNLKVNNGWTDKSFTTLLGLLKEMLPPDNCLPKWTYEAKKILRSIGLNYERIYMHVPMIVYSIEKNTNPWINAQTPNVKLHATRRMGLPPRFYGISL